MKPEVGRQWLLRGQGRIAGRPAEGPYKALADAVASALSQREALAPPDDPLPRREPPALSREPGGVIA